MSPNDLGMSSEEQREGALSRADVDSLPKPIQYQYAFVEERTHAIAPLNCAESSIGLFSASTSWRLATRMGFPAKVVIAPVNSGRRVLKVNLPAYEAC